MPQSNQQPKINHYETLGLDSSASKDEIKRAYRAKAKQSHPDKGGNHAEMSALTRAFHVLGDEDRRKQYDQTGSDSPRQDRESEILGLLMQVFAEGLQKEVPHVLNFAKKFISTLIEQQEQFTSKQRKIKARLLERRGKIITKKKGDVNLFHQLIDREIIQIDAQVAISEYKEGILKEGYDRLGEYKSREKDTVITATTGTGDYTIYSFK